MAPAASGGRSPSQGLARPPRQPPAGRCRCFRGGGTRSASRSKNSSGDSSTTPLAPGRVDLRPDKKPSSPRLAPAIPLPPCSYVPGHDLPHPVNDPRGQLYAARESAHEPPLSATLLATLPADSKSRRRSLPSMLAANSRWRYALDLFNEGFLGGP